MNPSTPLPKSTFGVPSLLRAAGAATVLLGASLAWSGCATTATTTTASYPAGAPRAKPDAILEGDQLKISFTGAPELDSTQEVRRDGRISLPLAGEVVAAGLLPEELAKELSRRFAGELVTSDVSVTVLASSFNVNVSGAVLRPGKYTSKRPMTALEAVMEAGGFDHAKADVRRVVVVRHGDRGVNNYVLDLSLPLEGKPSEPFYLKPSDIVYVPTRFVWF